jgi:alpha-D-ribose 1-methylphosphonate 5-triphosphate diphosphatase
MRCSEPAPLVAVTNGRVVTPEAVREDCDLLVRDGRIVAIVAAGDRPPGGEVLDACGGWVLPGFIDVHADYIERMAAPRPTSVVDFRLALREAERELLGHGITTMFHSLCFYGHSEFGQGPMREPEATRRFVGLVEEAHRARHLIRHRFHARFEIDALDRTEELEGYLRGDRVHLVSFMDHTPGQGQYRNLEIYRSTLKAWRGMADADVDKAITFSINREKLALEGLAEIATLARARRVAVASHDDDTVEKVELVHGIGATISEFPITLEVARRARELGMHTVAGAPNVLLGGSHSGNLSALEAVRDGSIDVLCSDYYPAALLHAVFALARDGLGMVEAAKLVTLHPARALYLDDRVGAIVPGLRADLLVVEELEDGFPAVTAALVDGRRVLDVRYREGAA